MELIWLSILIGIGWFVGWLVGFAISFILFAVGLVLIYMIWDDFIGGFLGTVIGIAITFNLISGYYYDEKSNDIIAAVFSSEKIKERNENFSKNGTNSETYAKVTSKPKEGASEFSKENSILIETIRVKTEKFKEKYNPKVQEKQEPEKESNFELFKNWLNSKPFE